MEGFEGCSGIVGVKHCALWSAVGNVHERHASRVDEGEGEAEGVEDRVRTELGEESS